MHIYLWSTFFEVSLNQMVTLKIEENHMREIRLVVSAILFKYMHIYLWSTKASQRSVFLINISRVP